MALQEAKKLYHREYMRRRRAGLPTRGVVKPKVMEQCSECVLPPSPERIVVSLGSGYRLCQCCYEAAGALFAAERACTGDEERRTPPSPPSTCSSWTAPICGASRSRRARQRWRASCATADRACG